MKNKELSELLLEMATLLEIADENRFRIRAYQNAAQTISDLSEDVEVLLNRGALTELPGVGPGIAEKIKEYCAAGKVQEHEKLKSKYPHGLLEMIRIGGLGPKRTRQLFDTMKIDSIAKLRQAAQNGKLKNLEGFGPKIEENILKGIVFQSAASHRILISDARQLSKNVVEEMQKKCRVMEKIVPAGSLRRWKETVGDLDFLCISKNPANVIGEFVRLSGVKQILAQGETKVSVIFGRSVQCDLRVVGHESFGAALLYFTGSKEHNVALREFALKKGFTLNEYGLYSTANKKKPVAGKSEEEIFAKLGLEFIPPELRENRGEIEAARKKNLPKLVEEKDIRGDFHNHTHLSDGADSLAEMAGRAKEKGWQWFVSADHSQSLKIAHGLSREALFKKKASVQKLNAGFSDFRVLLGSEVDILSDGKMDYDDAALREIDFVVASVHTGFSQNEEKITGRIVSALNNPHVDIIGHLTGRLLNSRAGYPVHFQKVLSEAARTGTALEINGQPQRLDLYDVHAKTAGEMGVKIALNTDAHSVAQLDNITLAVATARRAWLTKENILNCLTYDKLLRWKQDRQK